MDQTYFLILLSGAALSAALLFIRLRRSRERALAAFLTPVFSALLGFALAKVFYCVLLSNTVWPRWGFRALLRVGKPSEFSFFGGCAGMCLGALAAGKACGIRSGKMLDLFAPSLALMIAVTRLAEYRLGMLGMGIYLENEFLCFFPIGISNEWEEWYLAVFAIEALFALICCGVVLFSGRKPLAPDGLIFRRTVFYLALPQILCESLRAECMKWGFVRVEQVLCAVIAVALCAYTCYPCKKLSFLKRYQPVLAMLVCILIMIGAEFALDKTDLTMPVCYGAMIMALLGMAWLENYSIRRSQKAAEG